MKNYSSNVLEAMGEEFARAHDVNEARRVWGKCAVLRDGVRFTVGAARVHALLRQLDSEGTLL